MSYIRWNEVDKTLLAEDAIRECFKQGMVAYAGIWVFQGHIGFKANYGGYGHVSLKDIDDRKPLCQWFEGFTVNWIDEFWDDRVLPIKKIPVDQLDAECRAVYDKKLEELKPFVYHYKRQELLDAKATA